jgi:hypothetical protein
MGSILRSAELRRPDSGEALADELEEWQRDFLTEATTMEPDRMPKCRHVQSLAGLAGSLTSGQERFLPEIEKLL